MSVCVKSRCFFLTSLRVSASFSFFSLLERRLKGLSREIKYLSVAAVGFIESRYCMKYSIENSVTRDQRILYRFERTKFCFLNSRHSGQDILLSLSPSSEDFSKADKQF